MLSFFLTRHAALVELDYQACFEGVAAAINGDRPHARATGMSFGRFIAARPFASGDLPIAVLGLLPLLPFAIAWHISKTPQTRAFWFVSACVAVVAVITGTSLASLADFHDCDRNGVGVEILAAPILYMVVNMAAMSVLATLRYLFTL